MKNYYGNSPLEYGVFIMETTDDSVLRFVRSGELGAIPKKQGTPPKPKKAHVKGTKRHLGYQKERIKDGVKVLLRNGETRVVGEMWSTLGKETDAVCYNGYTTSDIYGNVWLKNGRIFDGRKSPWDIVRILDNVDNSVSSKPFYCIGDVFEHKRDGMGMLVDVAAFQVGMVGTGGGRFCEPFFHEGVFTQIPASTVEAMLLDAWHDPAEWKYLGKFSDMFQKRN